MCEFVNVSRQHTPLRMFDVTYVIISCVIGLICDTTYSCATWLVHTWHGSFLCHTNECLFVCVTDMIHLLVSCVMWLICDTIHSWLFNTWHDSFLHDMNECLFVCVTYHILCDVTQSYVTWLIHVWHGSRIRDMTPSCVTWGSASTHGWHATHHFICDVTHSYMVRRILAWRDRSLFRIADCRRERLLVASRERLLVGSFVCVMSHMNESFHIWMRHDCLLHHVRDCLLHHVRDCLLARSYVSCHIWMRHVTYDCVISHMNASFHIWMRHDFLLHDVRDCFLSMTWQIATWYEHDVRDCFFVQPIADKVAQILRLFLRLFQPTRILPKWDLGLVRE